jgi:hypothetical protein
VDAGPNAKPPVDGAGAPKLVEAGGKLKVVVGAGAVSRAVKGFALAVAAEGEMDMLLSMLRPLPCIGAQEPSANTNARSGTYVTYPDIPKLKVQLLSAKTWVDKQMAFRVDAHHNLLSSLHPSPSQTCMHVGENILHTNLRLDDVQPCIRLRQL